MSIEKLSKAIDYRVKQLVTAIEYKGYSRTGIDMVAEAIDAYRAEVAKEIEGLKGDVKAAEGWRDEWKSDAAASEANLEKAIEERDAALKEQGWAERACQCRQDIIVNTGKDLDQARKERDEALDQANQLRKSLYDERGGKTAIQLEAENASLKQKVENLGGQVSFLKKWVQDLQAERKVEYSVDTGFTPMTPGEFSEKFFGVDPGAPEGDKTVITFECCNVKHYFTPPKGGSWQHIAECHECGSKTSFGIS